MFFKQLQRWADRNFVPGEDEFPGILEPPLRPYIYHQEHIPEFWETFLAHIPDREEKTRVLGEAFSTSYQDNHTQNVAALKQLSEKLGLQSEMYLYHDPEREKQPFIRACERGDLATVQAITAAHKAINTLPDFKGLHFGTVCMNGYTKIGGILLDLSLEGRNSDLPINEIKAIGSDLETACKFGHVTMMANILAYMRKTECMGDELKHHGRNVLQHACKQKNIEMVEMLLTAVNEVGLASEILLDHSMDHNQPSEFTQACAAPNVPLARVILKKAQEGNILWELLGDGALRVAIHGESTEIAQLLIEAARQADLQGEILPWEKMARIETPPGLEDYNPHGFKRELYDRLLPLTSLAARVERTTMRWRALFVPEMIAEIHAYKLATLFSNEGEAGRYLDQYAKEWAEGDTKQPMHNALLFEFPKTGKWNIHRWKNLVLRYGPAASEYLGNAIAIEARLAEDGHAFPTTLRELQDAQALCTFSGSEKNPDFARLLMKLKLPQHIFDTGLEVLERAKTKDNLPEMYIDGALIGHPNFYMEKLPAGSPIGLVLGEITNCCQSLDKGGHACAVHGTTSENGGFYVWKHKTKGKRTPDDAIIAQSYAWLGKDKMLVLDSYERLGSAYDAFLQTFLEQFAHELKGTGIRALHIGNGGQTPKLDLEIAAAPAVPIDGVVYDSETQYLVPPVQHKDRSELRAEEKERSALQRFLRIR